MVRPVSAGRIFLSADISAKAAAVVRRYRLRPRVPWKRDGALVIDRRLDWALRMSRIGMQACDNHASGHPVRGETEHLWTPRPVRALIDRRGSAFVLRQPSPHFSHWCRRRGGQFVDRAGAWRRPMRDIGQAGQRTLSAKCPRPKGRVLAGAHRRHGSCQGVQPWRRTATCWIAPQNATPTASVGEMRASPCRA